MFIILYELDIIIFQTKDGKEPFNDWFNKLDTNTKKQIIYGLTKVRSGNFADQKYIGDGVSEFKFHFGSGYRIYFGNDGKRLIILLCAGDKRTQTSDIRKAKNYWRQYVQKNS